MDDVVVRHAHAIGPPRRRSRRRTTSLAEAGEQTLAFLRAHIPDVAIGAALRELHRHRPALPRCTAARRRELPPLPLDRRVERQGAVPALVPGCARGGAAEARGTPRAWRHPRVDCGACVLPVDDLHRRDHTSVVAIAGASSSRTHAGTDTAAARAAARRPRIATTQHHHGRADEQRRRDERVIGTDHERALCCEHRLRSGARVRQCRTPRPAPRVRARRRAAASR